MKKFLTIALLLMIACSAHAMTRIGYDSNYALPTYGFQLNENQMVDLGARYSSTNNGGTTNLWLLAKLENKIMAMDTTKLFWAGQIAVNSTAGTSTLWLDGIVGAEYKINKNLGVYGNIYLFTLSSGSGASSFWLLTGDANVYTGMRIYLD